jgi:chromosome partitioning protein
MRVISVANHKGGVGKTSLAVHLATGFSRQFKTLLIDLDAQGNATKWLAGSQPATGIAESLLQEDFPLALLAGKTLSIAPASRGLTLLDTVLPTRPGGQLALRRLLGRLEGGFEVVVIDCPPSIGQVVVNALAASTDVIVPVLPSMLALEGVKLLEETRQAVNTNLQGKAHMLGFALFATDKRESVGKQVRGALAKNFGHHVFQAEIRRSTSAVYLPVKGKTAWEPGADVSGAKDYAELFNEITAALAARRQ